MGSELTLPISRWCSSCKAENENGKAQQQGRPVGSPSRAGGSQDNPANLPGGANPHKGVGYQPPVCAPF